MKQPAAPAATPLTGLLLKCGAIAFAVDVLIMRGLSYFDYQDVGWNAALLNAALLIIVVSIVFHRWIVGPLDARLADTIAQLHQAQSVAERLSQHDSLTGMLNRRSFFERAEREWSRTARTGTPLSLLMLDVDHFKAVNDLYGHRAGDDVLKTIGPLMQDTLRQYDDVCRYGGEEFCVLLPDTLLDGAIDYAKRLNRAIADANIIHDGQTLPTTVSIGVACRDPLTPTIEMLIEAADQALLHAKQTGRNCVRVADVVTQEPLSIVSTL